MTFVVTIEGHDRRLEVAPGEILLAALLARGVRFAYSCQSGTCGACKCRLVSGRVHTLAYSEAALPQKERREGMILACRSRVGGDLTIRI